MDILEGMKLEIYLEIKKLLEENQRKIGLLDPDTEEFDKVLTEIRILKLDIEKIKEINQDNYEQKLNQMKAIIDKYDFLAHLDRESVITLFKLLKKYKTNLNKGDIGIKDKFSNPLLKDLKSELLLNQLDFKTVKNSKSIGSIKNKVQSKYDEFKENQKSLNNLLHITPAEYYMLDISNRINEIDIEKLKKIEPIIGKNLLDSIFSKLLLREKTKNSKMNNKKNEITFDEIAKEIKHEINKALDIVKEYLNNTYKYFNKKLGLSTIENNIPIEKLVNKIDREINEKDLGYKSIIDILNLLEKYIVSSEREMFINLIKLGIDPKEIKNGKVNLLDIENDDLLEILSVMDIYPLIKGYSKYKK